MKLPSMRYASRITKSGQVSFGGLNRSRGAGDGELSGMRNLTSDHAPLLAVRPPRYRVEELGAPGGLFSWEGLAWVDGTAFVFDGVERGQVTAGEKVFASLGAYIVIFPDKCWYNVDTGEFGPMESSVTVDLAMFQNGTIYSEPAEANTIFVPNMDWSQYFSVGDGVTISGCTLHPENNKQDIIREIDGAYLRFYEHSFALSENGGGYTEAGGVTITRTVPALEHLCENENRLWGCAGNTIYACKPGDVFNWNVFDGLDDDSYTTDVGSAGTFTGCVSFAGYPTFFKEDHIYKVYGSLPSNFEIMGSATMGLAKGCHKSLAVAGEALFYMSTSGMVAYTGGIPQPMGAAFGTERFRDAVAGSDGLKYYISMAKIGGGWGLYVYDTQKGLWHQEDDAQAVAFARWGGKLYMLNEQGQLWIMGNVAEPPADAVSEGPIQWEAEFADFTEGDPNKKGVSKLQLRLGLDPGAAVTAWLMFDSDGQWRSVATILGEGDKRSYYLPIKPRRADHYRLKLTGTGGCRIHSLAKEFYYGSEARSWSRRN